MKEIKFEDFFNKTFSEIKDGLKRSRSHLVTELILIDHSDKFHTFKSSSRVLMASGVKTTVPHTGNQNSICMEIVFSYRASS